MDVIFIVVITHMHRFFIECTRLLGVAWGDDNDIDNNTSLLNTSWRNTKVKHCHQLLFVTTGNLIIYYYHLSSIMLMMFIVSLNLLIKQFWFQNFKNDSKYSTVFKFKSMSFIYHNSILYFYQYRRNNLLLCSKYKIQNKHFLMKLIVFTSFIAQG